MRRTTPKPKESAAKEQEKKPAAKMGNQEAKPAAGAAKPEAKPAAGGVSGAQLSDALSKVMAHSTGRLMRALWPLRARCALPHPNLTLVLRSAKQTRNSRVRA